MKLLFLLKEGLAGFSRARLASFISIVTISLSLALLGIFVMTAQNLSSTFQRIYNRVHLDVFVDPSLSETEFKALEKRIGGIDEIESVEFISSEAAMEKYTSEFGGDLMEVLDGNPLPPSFKVVLRSGYRRMSAIDGVVEQIETIESVDEVAYQRNIIRLLNKYLVAGVIGAVIIGAIIFLISIVLIFNTIRLTIHSRKRVIEIMRLVGATNTFIKAPFLIEGMLQGFIGSIAACGILWLVADVVRTLLLPALLLPQSYLVLLVVTGVFLGLVGSYLSIGKYLPF